MPRPDQIALRHRLASWIGVELDEVSAVEKLVSTLGGVLAIVVLKIVCDATIGESSPVLVASMGASAVLLFAVPHGSLSQPSPVLAGHVVSAAIGVTCVEILGSTTLAAGLAVGLSIGAMHQFKFIHPPGGATALTAVIGGGAVTRLGYRFVLVPVALNAMLILVVAVAFNALFPWRRYPASRRSPTRSTAEARADARSHAAVVAALREVDSFVDITEDDLLRLHRIIARLEQADVPERAASDGASFDGR